MRVLTVVTDFGIGGTQRVAQNLTLGVKQAGVSVAVLAYNASGPRERFFRDSGVPVFAPDENDQSYPFIDEAIRWRPDIVHFHRSGYPNKRETALIQAFKGQGARIVETNVFARYDGTEARHLIDVHCLLSRWCWFKWSMWRASRDSSTATILPNAVDATNFKAIEAEERHAVRVSLGVPPGRFLFGRIGQPMPTKWSPKILSVFLRALASGNDIGLVLVGAPPEYAEEVARLGQSVRDRIVMLAPIDDDVRLRSLYCAMDAFLHIAEIGESFGMVLCEALLCGTPVITLSTPLRDNSQLEVVGHEQGGLVARDIEGVLEAMERIQRDEALRERVREKGSSWIEGRFGVNVVSSKAVQIYNSVLASTNRADLQRRLDALGDIPPDFSWLAEIQGKGLGSMPTLSQKALFRILHVPQVYATYQIVKRGFAKASR
ncbi:MULTISPECIES: glycosyltransferase family 4 protein [unclassified Bradyrhizobium]|uniref:glycosyltransferase family 4 protein n=1 Tax=unclassified Bradyrhizobium TaxID=2631580 RepID=UPI001FFA1EA7|nr:MULTISPECIES: glycosyltransferase family 4 protein [unclassified Bradyrhizobium]MCK1521651.1 glycosyltransferase family 4 protein [Bradyrhizobium sp. 17]MCK1684453.1 glycosyltransferase family 4 protein [Bradyrhizobium sp. 145]